jgi:biotin transport system substrate-specific component
MAKTAVVSLDSIERKPLSLTAQAGLIVCASFFIAICARVSFPLPFTPVPLTLQNFGVLLVGIVLGSRRGFLALALYLLEGAASLPVFNPLGPGGVAQLISFTGGFLMVYPFVALLAGWIAERGAGSFVRNVIAGFAGEILLFAGGLTWLYAWTHSVSQAIKFGLYWFVFAEVIKIMFAAAIGTRLRSLRG